MVSIHYYSTKASGVYCIWKIWSTFSLSSNRLAIAAPFAIGNSNTSSVVYFYSRTGSTWTGFASLYITNYEIVPNAASSISIANLTCGISVSLAGNTLLVGAEGGIEFPNGNSSGYGITIGAVYIYKNYFGKYFFPNERFAFRFSRNQRFFWRIGKQLRK